MGEVETAGWKASIGVVLDSTVTVSAIFTAYTTFYEALNDTIMLGRVLPERNDDEPLARHGSRAVRAIWSGSHTNNCWFIVRGREPQIESLD
jgi:hypothetical protein